MCEGTLSGSEFALLVKLLRYRPGRGRVGCVHATEILPWECEACQLLVDNQLRGLSRNERTLQPCPEQKQFPGSPCRQYCTGQQKYHQDKDFPASGQELSDSIAELPERLTPLRECETRPAGNKTAWHYTEPSKRYPVHRRETITQTSLNEDQHKHPCAHYCTFQGVKVHA